MGTVAFTGYRPNKLPFAEDKKDELYVAFRKKLRQVIDRLVERGYTDYISGIAMGFDTWVAEDVIEIKKSNPDIRLECAIPCPNQDKNWSIGDKLRRKKILHRANCKPVICEQYSSDCFHIRNRYMVDKADVVVCCYDGQRGGTAYTVDYALKADNIVIQINPKTSAVTIISKRNFD